MYAAIVSKLTCRESACEAAPESIAFFDEVAVAAISMHVNCTPRHRSSYLRISGPDRHGLDSWATRAFPQHRHEQ